MSKPIASLLILTLLAGCTPAVPTQTQQAPPAQPESGQQGPGVTGIAELPEGPFALAEVKVYRLDNDALVSQGTTSAEGAFHLVLPGDLPAGLPLKVVATKDGKTLGAIGSSTQAAPGAYALLQEGPRELRLNAASTLALMAFLKRLKAVAMASLNPNTNRIAFNALEKLLNAYARLTLASARTLQLVGGGSLSQSVVTSFKAEGESSLAGDLANLLTAEGSELQAALAAANTECEQAISAGLQAGGSQPPPELLSAISLGTATIGAITPTATGEGDQGAPPPTSTVSPTENTGVKSGGSGGGGSSSTTPVIRSATLTDTPLQVGTNTTLSVDATGATTYYYKASRGRIVGQEGETAGTDGYVKAGATVHYHAPFTSTYPSADGIQSGDTIEVIAHNATKHASVTINVSLTGGTVVLSTPQDGQTNGLLKSAVDSGDGVISAPETLLDPDEEAIEGVSPTISPNGDYIAYVYYPGDGTSQIRVLDASRQALTVRTGEGLNLDPAWSPEGNVLAFASNQENTDETFDLYTMALEDGASAAVTRLTNNDWEDRHPAWNPDVTAPDENRLAMVSHKDFLMSPGGVSQSWNVFLMDSTGSYTRQISQVSGGNDWALEPAWRPDGQALAYTRYAAVNSYGMPMVKFQRVFVQALEESPTMDPLNASNTDPSARESAPLWSLAEAGVLLFLGAGGAAPNDGLIHQVAYPAASPPDLLTALQDLALPITAVGGASGENLTGYRPFDWR